MKKKEALIKTEWQAFQSVQNEGGRASCQDDPQTFFISRAISPPKRMIPFSMFCSSAMSFLSVSSSACSNSSTEMALFSLCIILVASLRERISREESGQKHFSIHTNAGATMRQKLSVC